jgi:O-methyltransferase involved in polyketide biosynthesis
VRRRAQHGRVDSLKGVGWTGLVTLYLRASDARSEHPILGDQRAGQALERLRADGVDVTSRRLRATAGDRFLTALRAATIDRWLGEALEPGVPVLHLGCGLDTRAWRVGGWGRWIDVDTPQVVALRHRLYPEPLPGYELVAASVTDPRWLAERAGERVVVVAEGLFMYLAADDVRGLLNRLTSRFAHGRLIFDVAAPWIVRTSRRMPSAYSEFGMRWAPRGPQDVLDLAPDLRFVGAVDGLNPALRRGQVLPRRFSAVFDLFHRLQPHSLTVTRWEF